MKKRIFSLFLAACLLFLVGSNAIFAEGALLFDGGEGTQESPYLIGTKEQLNNIRKEVGAHYKLVSDIIFSESDFCDGGSFFNDGSGWIPIDSFNGVIDGNGHSIQGLTISAAGEHNGFVAINGGEILDLMLKDVKIDIENIDSSAEIQIGCFAGINNGTIENCRSSASSNVNVLTPNTPYNSPCIGGIAGVNTGVIKNCTNAAKLSVNFTTSLPASLYVAAITASNSGIIYASTNIGDVKSTLTQRYKNAITFSYASGICAHNLDNATISECANTGDVTVSTIPAAGSKEGTRSECGGIVAVNSGLISDSYNSGSIRAESAHRNTAGGIVSGNRCSGIEEKLGHIKRCYNIGNISAGSKAYNATTCIGGIAGYSYVSGDNYLPHMDSIEDCYYLNTIHQGIGNVGKDIYDSTEACTQKAMQSKILYLGYDFDSVWEISSGGYNYPTLRNAGSNLDEHIHSPAIAVSENLVEATCVNSGSYDEVVYCKECNYELKRTHKIVPPLGHNWDDGQVTRASTETEVGIMTFTCTRCGETKTETIPVLPHTHSYKAVVTAPTCTEKGYTTHTCACDDSYVDTYVDALGHAWDSGKVTKQPTATETGIRTYTCTRCSATKTETIPATGSVDVTQMFTDVTKNWAYPGIQYCVTHGIMGGMGNGTFAPTGTTTRAQIVQILYNLEGTPAVSGTTPFTDLTANWYKPAILWAYQNNVVAGTSPTTFDPEGPVTREQIAVILTQYMFHVLKMNCTWTPADLSTFPDGAQVSSWAKKAMQDAVALGLINGTKASDGVVYLDPQGSAARQQVATILMNFCQNVKK